jgi:hypothetical protein
MQLPDAIVRFEVQGATLDDLYVATDKKVDALIGPHPVDSTHIESFNVVPFVNLGSGGTALWEADVTVRIIPRRPF